MIPAAFFGSGAGGDIWLANRGVRDDGVWVPIRVRTNPVAPGGTNADCSFDRVFITLTWSIGVKLAIAPVVDGEVLADAGFNIEVERPASRQRISRVFERILRRTAMIRQSPAFKYVPRGTWFALEIVGRVAVSLADLADITLIPGEVDAFTGDVISEAQGDFNPGDLIFDDALLEYEVLSPSKELV